MPRKPKKRANNIKNSKVLVENSTIEHKVVGAFGDLKDDRPQKLGSNLILGCSFKELPKRLDTLRAMRMPVHTPLSKIARYLDKL